MKLSLFLGLGAVGIGVVFALLGIAALADPAVGTGVALAFAAIATAFLLVAHRALRVRPEVPAVSARSEASS